MGKGWARQGGTLRSVSSLRGILILSIIGYQSVEVSGSGGRLVDAAQWFATPLLIAALAGLAGFTMARSVDRNGLATFAVRTVIRFVPALTLVVLLSAAVVGLLLSNESASQYITDNQTSAYLLNIIGLYHASLPGVFEFNPDASAFNTILHVVPILYVGSLLLGLAHIKPKLTAPIVAITCLVLFVAGFLLPDNGALDPDRLDSSASIFSGQTLLVLQSLLLGSLAYLWRKHIFIAWQIACGAGIILLALLFRGDVTWFSNSFFVISCSVIAVYLALFITRFPLPLRHWAARFRPMHWRMLIIALPVQQTLVVLAVIPQLALVNLLVSLPIIVAIAAAEWYLIERPVLLRLGGPSAVQRPLDRSDGRSRRRDPQYYLAHVRVLLVRLTIGLILVLIMFALFAMTMFALQRETIGA